ncbi:hypothetical protein ABPG74_003063 [Tetrahymena malaccensis]
MLPFTNERLLILGDPPRDVFYYNRSCLIPEINIFSNAIFADLSNYLGIEFEINQRAKMSSVVDDEAKQYDFQKISRITMLYDFYVDAILRTTQLLYYQQLNNSLLYLYCPEVTNALKTKFVPNEGDIQAVEEITLQNWQNEIARQKLGNTKTDSKAFLTYFDSTVQKTGKRLSDCFKTALQKCQPLRTMVEEQINIEFPIDTLQDKIVKKEKIVVSTKKSRKKKQEKEKERQRQLLLLQQPQIIQVPVVPEEVKQQLKAGEEQLSDLKDLINDQAIQNETQKEKKQKYKKQLLEKEEEIKKLLSQIEEQDSKLKIQGSQIIEYDKKRKDNEKASQIGKQELSEHKEKWKSKKKLLKDKLEEKEQLLKEEKRKYDLIVLENDRVIQDKEHQLEEVTDALEKLRKEQERDKKEVSMSKISNSKLIDRIDQKTQEIEQLKLLKNERDRLQKDIKDLEAENSRLNQNIGFINQDLMQENTNLRKRIDDNDSQFREQAKNKDIQIYDLRRSEQEKQNQLQKLRSEIETVTNQKSEIDRQLQSQMHQSRLQMDSQQQLQSRIQEMNDSHRQQISDYDNRFRDQENQIEQKQQQLVQYATKIHNNEQIIENQYQRILSLENDMNNLRSQLDQLSINSQVSVQDSNARIQNLTNLISQLQLDNENVKLNNSQLQNQIQEQQSLISQRDSQIKDQQSLISQRDSQIQNKNNLYNNISIEKILLYNLKEENAELAKLFTLEHMNDFIKEIKISYQNKDIADYSWSDLIFYLNQYATLKNLKEQYDLLNQKTILGQQSHHLSNYQQLINSNDQNFNSSVLSKDTIIDHNKRIDLDLDDFEEFQDLNNNLNNFNDLLLNQTIINHQPQQQQQSQMQPQQQPQQVNPQLVQINTLIDQQVKSQGEIDKTDVLNLINQLKNAQGLSQQKINTLTEFEDQIRNVSANNRIYSSYTNKLAEYKLLMAKLYHFLNGQHVPISVGAQKGFQDLFKKWKDSFQQQ